MTDDDYRDLKRFCEMFRRTVMHIRKKDDCVTMELPYTFDDCYIAAIETRVMSDGNIRVSDGGLIAKHETLSMDDVRVICENWRLEYELKSYIGDVPLNCEIYKIVDRTHFGEAVYRIIHAITDAQKVWMQEY